MAEALRNKGLQTGEDRRQYKEERQKLYKTRGDRERRIGDDTETKVAGRIMREEKEKEQHGKS